MSEANIVRVGDVMNTRFDLSQAPVIDDGKVVGIVGFSNLVFGGLCKF
jgi:predicted transcriptional regulator